MGKSTKFLHFFLFSLVLVGNFSMAVAEESQPLLDKNKFSLGAGVSLNSVNGPIDNEIGFQFFAAYDLTRINLMEGVNSSVEFGFMDYGFQEQSRGAWATYVVDGAINGKFGWLARLGLDLGDDSGLMIGAGADYEINEKMDLRLEYVVRDEVGSLQFNFLYRL